MKNKGVFLNCRIWKCLGSFKTLQNYHHHLLRSYNKCTTNTKIDVEKRAIEIQNELPKSSIVISGISGRFPQSNSMEEFKKNLMDQKDLLQPQTRFEVGDRLPPRIGLIDNLDKFDAEFFNVPDKIANVMNPAGRKLLEVTFEAIIDAGINPESLKGSSTGVFVASDASEILNYWNIKHGKSELDGCTAIGVPSFMEANQISYLFDLKGTSLTISTGCSSSLHAVESAVTAILAGKCERAIVAGTSLHLLSHQSNDLHILGSLSPTGECKPFDKSANGFVRSEAIVSVIIEKEKFAKRCYAKILGIGSSTDGFKKKGIFNPSGISHQDLYRQIYTGAGIDPGSVCYIETHGTGTQTGDPQEIIGISEVFCKTPSRTEPLLIGSVKSNMGHGEAAAGLCSIAKILIATQEGIIPRTLHFSEPNLALGQFLNGSLKVATENTLFTKGIVGINSFGLGGTNTHLILEIGCNDICKFTDNSVPKKDLPILIPLSGQSEETLKENLKQACAYAKNANFSGLIHQVFKEPINGHPYRGYAIAQYNEDSYSNLENFVPPPSHVVKVSQNFQFHHEKRPIWLIFSGMGCQWQGMGTKLMKIDTFQESFKKSRIILKNIGVNLDYLLKPGNTSIFENIHDAYNTIAIMQIALYDTIKSTEIGIQGYIGHSFGEILCAYADGSLTTEETLQIVDACGRAMLEGIKKDSSGTMAMAAIGLSWQEIQRRCPLKSGIFPACHNGPQNVTVSGKESAINEFLKKLQNEEIFAKKINSCGVAIHSPLIYPAATLYFNYLQEILKGKSLQKRKRTKRWISTSIPESEWNSNLAQNASPEYFLNNFVNPVLFYEALSHIPKNAILIEIAPQGLLKGILKASLPNTCQIVAPMQKKNQLNDEILHFFTSLGDIYNAGCEMNFSKLYPPVKFPVNCQTPSINSLIEWKHDRSWIVPILENTEKYVQNVLNIDLEDSAFSYLEGHKLEDRLVFPATGYLVFAWQCLASSLGCNFEKLPVKFENVSFERAVFLNWKNPTQLRCYFHGGEAPTFEINENGSAVAHGNISSSQFSSIEKQIFNINFLDDKSKEKNLNTLDTKDIYKELRIRGYNFSGDFQSIKQMDLEGKWSQVFWKGNWTTFLDSILQSSLLGNIGLKSTFVPVKITSLELNPSEVQNYLKENIEKDCIPVQNCIHSRLTLAPGIKLNSVICQSITKRNPLGNLAISEYAFRPYFEDKNDAIHFNKCPLNSEKNSEHLNSSVAKLIGIYIENCRMKKIIVYDTFTKWDHSLGILISKIFATQPMLDYSIVSLSTEEVVKSAQVHDKEETIFTQKLVTKTSIEQCIPEHRDADLVFLDDPMLLEPISKIIKTDSWIILRNKQEQFNLNRYLVQNELQFISGTNFETENLMLFKKTDPRKCNGIIQSLSIDEDEFNWVPKLKKILSSDSLLKNSSRIYIYSQQNPTSGIIGLVKCLMRENGGDKLRCIFDPEGKLKLDFHNSKNCPKLSEILTKDLVMNVFQNGHNGSYRHISINPDILEKSSKIVENAKVVSTKAGDLSSLKWIEFAGRKYLGKNSFEQKLININYASLNFRDIMLASGRLPSLSVEETNFIEAIIGFEFSGMDEKGNRIMALGPSNCIATSALIGTHDMAWKIPEKWSLEEAATVPIVYTTVYYSLIMRGKIKPHQSILIHSGTGGVGQAAINLALSMNCNVFTTVGTEEKRKHILQLFPSLLQENISSSRNCDFEQNILENTNGKGVDFVLNSLAEDKLHASLRCLAFGGTFLEIGKLDLYKDSSIGLLCLLKNINFQVIDFTGLLFNSVPGKQIVHKLMQEGIDSGVVKPLQSNVFSKDQVEDAFRYMVSGNHIGKVLIQVKKESENAKRRSATVKAIPKTYFDPKKTFLIVGGLGGLGLELADWMVQRGAKHLILTSRSGVSNGYQQLCLKRFEKSGVRVETPKIDLSTFDTAKTFLEDFIKEGKVLGGFFNSGLVLKDSLLENQTEEMFKEVAKPKIKVTENMDKLTREFCKDHLDYFVTFSSLSAGLGNAGQSNYGFANSAMEQICLQRRKDGLHAASIQWGVIGDVGYVAENMKEEIQIFNGMLPQKVSSCLEVLDAFLLQSKASSSTIFSSMVINDKNGEGTVIKKSTLLEAVTRLCNTKQALEDINPLVKLTDLGLDSLSGTELQQLLFREHDLQVSSAQVQALTWGDILKMEKQIQLGNNVVKMKTIFGDKEKSLLNLSQGNGRNESGKILTQLQFGKESKGYIPLFIVHGSEGSALPFFSLASKLDCPVYAFQTGERYAEKEAIVLKLEEFAQSYLDELKLVQPKGPYNLSGYSGGASIAYVMADILENKYNEQVNLVLLDGYCAFGVKEKQHSLFSMMVILDLFDDALSLTEEEKQKLLHKWSTMDIVEHRSSVQKWFNDKFQMQDDIGKKKMRGIHNHFYTLINVFTMVSQFTPTRKFKGRVSNIKPNKSILSSLDEDEHYNFNKFCEEPILSTIVHGDHQSFLQQQNVQETVNAINKVLIKT